MKVLMTGQNSSGDGKGMLDPLRYHQKDIIQRAADSKVNYRKILFIEIFHIQR